VGGAGGVGKTRLALEIGMSLAAMDGPAPVFPDGVWLVELAPVSDAGLVADTVATALGIPASASAAWEKLTGYLHARNLLLILDNCEHLIAACAELVETLLEDCPRLHLLATSREALNVPGEVAWRVPSLVTAEAVQLFVERGQTAWPEFALTDQNAAIVTEICQQLDGMPLALELAAALLRVLSVEQIASRLYDRFCLLTGGARTALPRQQTLRATIDWSYGLLTEDERILLQRLSVFAGGWTLEAAETVCGDSPLALGGAACAARPSIPAADILHNLIGLVDKSLVSVMTERRDGQVRYYLLETIRQYARDRLGEAGQSDVLRDRHLA
jgi:predicted ATPase